MGSYERTEKSMHVLKSFLEDAGLNEFLPKLEMAFVALTKESKAEMSETRQLPNFRQG